MRDDALDGMFFTAPASHVEICGSTQLYLCLVMRQRVPCFEHTFAAPVGSDLQLEMAIGPENVFLGRLMGQSAYTVHRHSNAAG
jgi:hypothetical protein